MLGSMGAGLMVGTGTALSRGTRFLPHTSIDPEICTGGPLGMLLGYIFVGASDSFFITLELSIHILQAPYGKYTHRNGGHLLTIYIAGAS